MESGDTKLKMVSARERRGLKAWKAADVERASATIAISKNFCAKVEAIMTSSVEIQQFWQAANIDKLEHTYICNLRLGRLLFMWGVSFSDVNAPSSWSQVGSGSDSGQDPGLPDLRSLVDQTWVAIATADDSAITEINRVVSGLPRESLINAAFQDSTVREFAEGAFTTVPIYKCIYAMHIYIYI